MINGIVSQLARCVCVCARRYTNRKPTKINEIGGKLKVNVLLFCFKVSEHSVKDGTMVRCAAACRMDISATGGFTSLFA